MQERNRFLVSNVSGPEVKRQNEANLRPSSPQRLFGPPKIPPDKSGSGPQLPPTWRLLRENRFKSGLFSHSHKREPPKISSLRLPGRTIPDDVSSVRTFQRTTSLLPHIQMDSRGLQRKGYESPGIPGRLHVRTSRPFCIRRPNKLCGESPTKPRLVHKFREISPAAQKKIRISGDRMGYKHKQGNTSRREDSPFVERSGTGDAEASMVMADRFVSNRPISFCSSGGSSWSSTHQKHSKSRAATFARPPQPIAAITSSGRQRLSLVDSQCEKDRQDFRSRSHNICNDRCIRRRLGCSNRKLPSFRAMDSRASLMAHKQEGTFRCVHHTEEMPRYGGRSFGYDSIRQQNRGLVPKKSGRNSIGSLIGGNQEDIVTSGSPECDNPFLLSTRPLQFHRRLFIEREKTSRLARLGRDHKEGFLEMGVATNRPFCHQPINSSSSVCVDRGVGPTGSVYQCFQPDLAIPTCVGLSSSTPDTQSASSPQPIPRHLPTDGATMGNCVLEGRPEAESSRSSHSDTRCQQLYNRPSHRLPPSEREGLLFRGLESTGWSQLLVGLEQSDIDLVQSAWRDSTWRTYASAWKQWVSWCKKCGKDPGSPRPQDVATYLGFLLRVKKLAASTILVHKSVVLTLADPTHEMQLATHPLVSAIVRAIGIKQCATSSPKPQIWNVKDLLGWLKSHCPSDDSIYQVSRHVALLLLLASGRRVHDLTLLSIDDQHCDRSGSVITFWPKFGSKTDNTRIRQSGWELTCSGDPVLSLVKWVNCLIELSASRRSARPNLHSLFITTRGEVKAASRAVIAGWLKAPFRDLGINCSPGSIRSAVASNSYQNNVPLDSILRRGNWKGSNNFFKHYCKSVEHPRTENVDNLSSSFSAV